MRIFSWILFLSFESAIDWLVRSTQIRLRFYERARLISATDRMRNQKMYAKTRMGFTQRWRAFIWCGFFLLSRCCCCSSRKTRTDRLTGERTETCKVCVQKTQVRLPKNSARSIQFWSSHDDTREPQSRSERPTEKLEIKPFLRIFVFFSIFLFSRHLFSSYSVGFIFSFSFRNIIFVLFTTLFDGAPCQWLLAFYAARFVDSFNSTTLLFSTTSLFYVVFFTSCSHSSLLLLCAVRRRINSSHSVVFYDISLSFRVRFSQLLRRVHRTRNFIVVAARW